MGACEGECWDVGSGDLPGTHCAQWEGLPWVHVQVISLHTLCPVGGATMGACEGKCWGVGSGDLASPVNLRFDPQQNFFHL